MAERKAGVEYVGKHRPKGLRARLVQALDAAGPGPSVRVMERHEPAHGKHARDEEKEPRTS
jgi:hypothetical protein